MSDTNPEIKTVDHKPHAAFFRQSGWLMIAAVAGGAMTWGVHFLAKSIPEEQYAVFGTLLMVVACMPTMPLQMIFAQQTALALARGSEKQLAGMIRLAWIWTFLVWAAGAVLVFVFQKQIVAGWHLPNASGLWVTLPLLLLSLWLPMFGGVVQGRQDFFWLGWSTILGGAGRLLAAAFLVLALGLGATGMMTGAMVAVGLSVTILVWRSRDLWSLRSEPFDGKSLMKQVVPLMFGFGACQFMLCVQLAAGPRLRLLHLGRESQDGDVGGQLGFPYLISGSRCPDPDRDNGVGARSFL
jgi:hypothetical protein